MEEVAVTDSEAEDGSNDGVEGDERLVRKKCEKKKRVDLVGDEVVEYLLKRGPKIFGTGNASERKGGL